MIIKLHHLDGSEMCVDSNDITEMCEFITKEKPYTTVHLKDYYIVCVEKISEIKEMLKI